MLSLSLSAAAREKIARDTKLLREVRGAGLKPVLSRYVGCFSLADDGSRIDHGNGFHLRFVVPGEPTYEDVAPIIIGDGLEVSLRWGGDLPDGRWVIDYQDRSFALVKDA
jgi:hypothetical protein